MNRATAIIGGVLLFGLGLFLGMVGSFVRTLAPEPPATATTPAHAAATTNTHAGAAHSRPAAPSSPSPMESALSETLAMVAVALAMPPSTTPPPASEASGVTSPNAPEQPSLDTVVADAVDGPVPMDPLTAAATPPPASPPPMPSPNPLAGRWVFDPRLGWLWLPENNATVVIVPMVAMFPAGLVTISRPTKPVAAKIHAASFSSTQQPGSSPPQLNAPGAKPSTTSPPFPGRR